MILNLKPSLGHRYSIFAVSPAPKCKLMQSVDAELAPDKAANCNDQK